MTQIEALFWAGLYLSQWSFKQYRLRGSPAYRARAVVTFDRVITGRLRCAMPRVRGHDEKETPCK